MQKDAENVKSVSYACDLPFGKGRWLGGWQTCGIWSFQTGRPSLPPDNDNNGTGRSALGFGANDRPDYIRSAELFKAFSNTLRYCSRG